MRRRRHQAYVARDSNSRGADQTLDATSIFLTITLHSRLVFGGLLRVRRWQSAEDVWDNIMPLS